MNSPPPNLKLTLLGTGTPRPSCERTGSSYLVQLGAECLLFDCGPGAWLRLLQAGKSPVDLSHLFLTHLHYDHCADYAAIELTRWDQGAGRIRELAVVGPEGTTEMSERVFGERGVFARDLLARTTHPASIEVFETRGGRGPRQRPAPRITELADGGAFDGGEWRVRAAQVVHCEPQLTTLAYRLETPAGTIVFGADTSPTQRLTALAAGADVLIHMCHFLNGPGVDPRNSGSCSGHLDAATTARDAGVGRLVLVHITPQVEAAHRQSALLAEAGAIFSGPIILGEDLKELAVIR